MPPKFIQIAVDPSAEDHYATIYALGEDGSVYFFIDTPEELDKKWSKLEATNPVAEVQNEVQS